MTGMTFGRLTVIARDKNTPGGSAMWLCECSCGSGKKRVVLAGSLRNGHTKIGVLVLLLSVWSQWIN